MPRKPKSKKTSAVRRQLATAPHCHPGFDRIKSLAASIHELQLQMAKSYAPIVQNIIQHRSRNVQEIEQALDRVLDCACIPEGLELFKHLCRYYYSINPTATAHYVFAYREMWDNEADHEEEIAP
jgi:hypothetical protein